LWDGGRSSKGVAGEQLKSFEDDAVASEGDHPGIWGKNGRLAMNDYTVCRKQSKLVGVIGVLDYGAEVAKS